MKTGLWIEVCLAMSVLSTLAEGYEVYIVTDASGDSSPEVHERGVQRMVQADARPINAMAYISELQRDRKNDKTASDVVNQVVQMGGTIGQGFLWK